jgi:hypothetical protein
VYEDPDGDLVRELEATVIEAGQCLRYWRAFNDPDHIDVRTPVMNRYPDFFSRARRAFFTTAIVDLYKLFDTTKNTATIRTLRKRVGAEPLKHPGCGREGLGRYLRWKHSPIHEAEFARTGVPHPSRPRPC